MLIRIGLIVLVFTCVHTIENLANGYYNPGFEVYYKSSNVIRKRQADLSAHNGGEVKNQPLIVDKVNESANNLADKAGSKDVVPKKETVVGESEGGTVKEDPSKIDATHISAPNVQDKNIKTVNGNTTVLINGSTLTPQVVANSTTVKSNVTTNATVDSTASESLVNKPGVVKRGLIVFGGFSLLAAAYFIFYRRKSKNYDSNAHSNGDANQFRYGVLQSDDRRDNLELSQIPLTMESDDEEEDLEIFDLEQKRKSLSYVSLQVNDEDIVLNSSKDESKNNLLLDIEDGSSDTLINWSSTVEECKENWNKLRNCYNNAMKRRQKKSGQAAKIIAPWRFEGQMSFLKQYLEGRPTIGNLDVTVSNEDSPLPSPKSPFSESQTSTESIPPRTSTPTSNASYKRKASSIRDDYLADIMEMMKSSQENRNKKQEMDDLDTFFLSMSKTVKKLPTQDQIRIKINLLKAISEAELKQLESQQNVLRTPITITNNTSRISGQSRDYVNSASGSFERPHTSYSSPVYVVELPNTQTSSEATNYVEYSSPTYVREVANSDEIGEGQNIRYYYDNNKM